MKLALPFGGQALQIAVPGSPMGQLLAPGALPALQDVGKNPARRAEKDISTESKRSGG